MKPANNEKLNRAFTLVELLVVISVIGLLMGILVPALGKARRTANRTYCKANLRQLGVAMRAYLDDNRDIFPTASNIAYAITDTNDPMYRPPITKFLGPLLKEPKVFICKADTVEKYYLKNNCGINYAYKGYGSGGLAGRTIRETRDVQNGIKEKNIEVMNDFDDFHPISGRPPKLGEPRNPNYVVGINYLYADWHIGDLSNQD